MEAEDAGRARQHTRCQQCRMSSILRLREGTKRLAARDDTPVRTHSPQLPRSGPIGILLSAPLLGHGNGRLLINIWEPRERLSGKDKLNHFPLILNSTADAFIKVPIISDY